MTTPNWGLRLSLSCVTGGTETELALSSEFSALVASYYNLTPYSTQAPEWDRWKIKQDQIRIARITDFLECKWQLGQ